MNAMQALDLYLKEVEKRLQKKTGWGRIELMTLLYQARIEVGDRLLELQKEEMDKK